MLPNLLVIGAERSGTTSLHRYLGSHPEVFMSRWKELDFFVAERNWRRGRAWYERQFASGAKVQGESSPTYTAYPNVTGVPARIASLLPDVKLIYLVRDPVERTISALHLARALGFEPRPATEALRPLETSPYLARSRYATQLEQYLEHFPVESIAVVDSDELRRLRRDTLRGVFRFLGVDEDVWTPAMDVELNAAKRRRRNRAGRALWRLAPRAIGAQAWEVVRHTPAWAAAPLTAPLAPTVLDTELRAELESALAPEAARLRSLTGGPFASWSV